MVIFLQQGDLPFLQFTHWSFFYNSELALLKFKERLFPYNRETCPSQYSPSVHYSTTGRQRHILQHGDLFFSVFTQYAYPTAETLNCPLWNSQYGCFGRQQANFAVRVFRALYFTAACISAIAYFRCHPCTSSMNQSSFQ